MSIQSNPAAHTLTSAKPRVNKALNFCAGPAQLPPEVVEQAIAGIRDADGHGIGILEQSHRGPTFDQILTETEAACRKIANIPANYRVLFLTGGATTQNFMVPANILPDNGAAAFLTTGYWAEKTWAEVGMYSKRCYEAWDGRAHKHAFCPSDAELKYADAPAYVHMCSNNTIYGTQWRVSAEDGAMRYPKVPDGAPLVCDASSDIFSRPIDIKRFGLIYAGAQKNIGIAGTTMVIIREDLVKPVRSLPTMLRYDIHAKDDSRHNTPPVFAIYLSGLMFKWILAQGGLAEIHRRNMAKAKAIYDVLDGSKFYTGHARPDSRSLMNITFRTKSAELDNLFISRAEAAGMYQLRGHRATGGMRASVYNAMPEAGCRSLADFMKDFERANG